MRAKGVRVRGVDRVLPLANGIAGTDDFGGSRMQAWCADEMRLSFGGRGECALRGKR